MGIREMNQFSTCMYVSTFSEGKIPINLEQ